MSINYNLKTSCDNKDYDSFYQPSYIESFVDIEASHCFDVSVTTWT